MSVSGCIGGCIGLAIHLQIYIYQQNIYICIGVLGIRAKGGFYGETRTQVHIQFRPLAEASLVQTPEGAAL